MRGARAAARDEDVACPTDFVLAQARVRQAHKPPAEGLTVALLRSVRATAWLAVVGGTVGERRVVVLRSQHVADQAIRIIGCQIQMRFTPMAQSLERWAREVAV